VRRLRERDVPDEAIFDSKIRVKCGANAGTANPMLRAQKYEKGMMIAANRPGWNARWFDEQFVANVYGAQAVRKALLPEGSSSMPEQRRTARFENLSFGQGVEQEVSPSDAHAEHAEEHLKVLEPLAGQYRSTQQIGPEQLTTLTIGIEHTGQHLAILKEDELQKQKFQQLWPTFSAIQSIVRGILMRLASTQQQGGGTPTGAAPGSMPAPAAPPG
jgi:hypothetical protein